MKIYILCGFAILMLLPLLQAQNFIYKNDTAVLSLSGQTWGSLNWQRSTDNVNWVDIPGATVNNYAFAADSTSYFRARITGGGCDPFYSGAMHIDIIEFHCGDTLIDYRDGKKYPTVAIGTQCWMAKNLDLGTMINNTFAQTNNGIVEKYCYNNDSNNCVTDGGLYQWDEMMDYSTVVSSRGICPCGWHVPSDQEWIDLEVILGMDPGVAALYNTWRGTDQGTQLKAGGTSGYNAVLAGCSIPGGYFNAIDMYEYMHASTEYGTNGWRRCLRTGDATVGRWNTFPKSYGLSVRCMKD